jgi:CHASE3 domain sensor protein
MNTLEILKKIDENRVKVDDQLKNVETRLANSEASPSDANKLIAEAIGGLGDVIRESSHESTSVAWLALDESRKANRTARTAMIVSAVAVVVSSLLAWALGNFL